MFWKPLLRLLLVLFALTLIFVYIWRHQADANRATLLVTMVIAALTAVYAVLTFEIVLQNQKMTKAASESASVMERSLRFSYAPNLIFVTLVTKDPTLVSENNFTPYKNADYSRACKDLPEGEHEMEFVFAVVRNVGKGPATKVQLKAQYDVKEKTNPNYNFTVAREASAALVEPDNAIALIIHVASSPSEGDGVQLSSAALSCGDFYRDALGEPPQKLTFTGANNTVKVNDRCKLKAG
jgi:hypothetical protein